MATINGKEYNLAPVTVETLEHISIANKTGLAFNIALVAGSIYAGGDTAITEDAIRKLPFFSETLELIEEAKKVNGLKSGEAQPAGPAESTSSTSTEA